jgi:hypothetical protein
MRNINPNEMIEWFESKSLEFKGIAKTLRETFNSQGQPLIQPTTDNETTVERVRAVLEKLGNARHSRIAGKLNADPEVVRSILAANRERFEMIGRGWWKVKP